MAMAYLVFYETAWDEKEKKKNETSLFRAVEDTQTLGEKRLEENPRNLDACFSMAIARMVKNRWEIIHRNYFRAFREARQSGISENPGSGPKELRCVLPHGGPPTMV
jgi:ABC-type protease/lipase transport system fused ATPase/permease subunit